MDMLVPPFLPYSRCFVAFFPSILCHNFSLCCFKHLHLDPQNPETSQDIKSVCGIFCPLILRDLSVSFHHSHTCTYGRPLGEGDPELKCAEKSREWFENVAFAAKESKSSLHVYWGNTFFKILRFLLKILLLLLKVRTCPTELGLSLSGLMEARRFIGWGGLAGSGSAGIHIKLQMKWIFFKS